MSLVTSLLFTPAVHNSKRVERRSARRFHTPPRRWRPEKERASERKKPENKTPPYDRSRRVIGWSKLPRLHPILRPAFRVLPRACVYAHLRENWILRWSRPCRKRADFCGYYTALCLAPSDESTLKLEDLMLSLPLIFLLKICSWASM